MMKQFFIRKANGVFVKIDTRDIICVEASGGCSKIVTSGVHHIVNSTLSQWEEILPAADFCRVNRSCIVGIGHINSFNLELIFVGEREVPLGKGYAERFFERVKVVL